APASSVSFPLSLHDALPIWFSSGFSFRLLEEPCEWGLDSNAQLFLQSPCLSQELIVDGKEDFGASPAGACQMGGIEGIESHVLRSEEHTSELQSRENLVCRL